MKLNTKHHGVKEYKEEDIVTFPKGLPGFEEYKKFIIFPVEENEIFSILHSLEDEELGLVIISPFDTVKEYEFQLKEDTIESLRIQSPEEVLVYCTVTLSSKMENITVNLKAPIVINKETARAEQIILDAEEYKIKHPLFKEGAECL